jgi:hypothetical protein
MRQGASPGSHRQGEGRRTRRKTPFFRWRTHLARRQGCSRIICPSCQQKRFSFAGWISEAPPITSRAHATRRERCPAAEPSPPCHAPPHPLEPPPLPRPDPVTCNG